jgi:hypothetical protein
MAVMTAAGKLATLRSISIGHVPSYLGMGYYAAALCSCIEKGRKSLSGHVTSKTCICFDEYFSQD